MTTSTTLWAAALAAAAVAATPAMATEPANGCPVRFTGAPQCDTTYAERLGDKYTAYHVCYAIISVAVSAIAAWQSYVIFVRDRHPHRPLSWRTLSKQQWIFLLVDLTCLTLLIRSIDPHGWNTTLPTQVVTLSYDWATAALTTAVVLIVRDWVRLTCRLGGKRHMLPAVELYCRILIGVMWSVFTVVSLLQSSVETYWPYHAIKLTVGGLVILSLFFFQMVFGVIIDRMLKSTAEANAAQDNNKVAMADRAADGGDDDDEDEDDADGGGDEEDGTQSQKETSSAAKKTKFSRIIHLLFYAGLIELFAGIFTLIQAAAAVSNKYTRTSNPPPVPTTGGDILVNNVFDTVHWLAALVAMWFFSPSHAANKSSNRA